MVEVAKATASPVTGCVQRPCASCAISRRRAPRGGGNACSGPTIAKRSRAQRPATGSRFFAIPSLRDAVRDGPGSLPPPPPIRNSPSSARRSVLNRRHRLTRPTRTRSRESEPHAEAGSQASPPRKGASNAPGRSPSSNPGTNRARCARQNTLAANVSRHHTRHRRSVSALTPSRAHASASARDPHAAETPITARTPARRRPADRNTAPTAATSACGNARSKNCGASDTLLPPRR